MCVNEEPWYDLCVQPPCGQVSCIWNRLCLKNNYDIDTLQLNPYEEEIYDILEKIYREWYDMFDFDTFHMGADEVSFKCWNSSARLKVQMRAEGLEPTEEGHGNMHLRLYRPTAYLKYFLSSLDFIKIWTRFQEKSSARLKVSVPEDLDMDIIIWSSDLTKPEYVKNLPKEDYIIQFWGNGSVISITNHENSLLFLTERLKWYSP